MCSWFCRSMQEDVDALSKEAAEVNFFLSPCQRQTEFERDADSDSSCKVFSSSSSSSSVTDDHEDLGKYIEPYRGISRQLVRVTSRESLALLKSSKRGNAGLVRRDLDAAKNDSEIDGQRLCRSFFPGAACPAGEGSEERSEVRTAPGRRHHGRVHEGDAATLKGPFSTV